MVADLLSHPLVILLAGTFASGWLVPRITRRWQDQRRGLEVQAELVERVTSAVTAIFIATQFAQVGARSQTQEDFDKAYRSWEDEKAVLTALLKAYFRNDALDVQWLTCRALATAYYVQLGIKPEDRRCRYLHMVANGLEDKPEPLDLTDVVPGDREREARTSGSSKRRDLTNVAVLHNQVRRELDRTVQLILDTPVVALG